VTPRRAVKAQVRSLPPLRFALFCEMEEVRLCGCFASLAQFAHRRRVQFDYSPKKRHRELIESQS
jgi:hypothetical protein